MPLSMVSTAFQAVIGEIAGTANNDLTTQCFYAFLRIVILSATFVVAQRTFHTRKNRKAYVPARVLKASPKKMTGYKGKRPFNPPVEDDDVSTAMGSSDSESDSISSDQDQDVKGTKISISELLKCRPAAGNRPQGSIQTMRVGSSLPQRRQWDTVRNNVSVQHSQAPAKTASKPADGKGAKASPKPCKTAPVPKQGFRGIGDSAAAASPERIQALLSIICSEEETTHTNEAKTDSGPLRQTAFPPGLEPSINVPGA